MHRPLADEIRPLELDDVVGQKHILGPGGLLRRVIDSGNIPNMVFYGPSGTGKTTVANIIARKTDRTLRRLNATNASLADIKSIIAELDTMLTPGGVLLYLDEIQYFNKKQQQSLLEFIEDGRITLIASTTENPYFYVYNALLSRSTVFEFKSVPPAEVVPAVRRDVYKRQGQEIARRLAEENHDITVVDTNADCLEEISTGVDAMVLYGNGADYTVLSEAGVSDADLLIAVTSDDSVNMLCCLTGKKLGVKNTVARVRTMEYFRQMVFLKDELGLSLVLNPEQAAASEISRILRFPSAAKVESFAKGRAEMVEFTPVSYTHLISCCSTSL